MIAFIKRRINIVIDAVCDKYFLTWFIPLMVIALFVAGLLFELVSYDRIFKLAHLYSTHCRELSDKEAFAMLMTIFIAAVSCLTTVGELMIFADKRRRGLPIEHTSLIISASAAVISLVLILVLSQQWCR